DLRLGVVRREPRGGRELALGGDRPVQLLERGAVEELRAHASCSGLRPEERELCGWPELRDLGRRSEARLEVREVRNRELRVQEIAGADGVERVRREGLRPAPGRPSGREVAAPEVREPELELHER